jgi:hypothetical protein
MNRGRWIGSENVIAASLAAAVDKLDALPESARVWELRAKAVDYEQVVMQWKVATPSDRQVDTMVDLVVALHGKIREVRSSLRSSPIHGERPVSDAEVETRDV